MKVNHRLFFEKNVSVDTNLYDWFTKISENHKPKLITIRDYLDLTRKERVHFNDIEMCTNYALQVLQRYKFYNSESRDLENPKTNRWFHSNKVSWMIDQKNTIGLYSPMQACIRPDSGKKIKLHPGVHRFCANYATNSLDEKIVFWDAMGDSDSDVLSFDEWVNLWPIEKCRDYGICDTMIEVNVEEERKDMWNFAFNLTNMMGETPPHFIGSCSDDISHLLSENTNSKFVIESKVDREITKHDLLPLLSINPSVTEIKTKSIDVKII